jgi:hypothetical protein
MFFNAVSFNQDPEARRPNNRFISSLCETERKLYQVKSSEYENANRRCRAIEGYIQSFTDLIDSSGAFEDFCRAV